MDESEWVTEAKAEKLYRELTRTIAEHVSRTMGASEIPADENAHARAIPVAAFADSMAALSVIVHAAATMLMKNHSLRLGDEDLVRRVVLLKQKHL